MLGPVIGYELAFRCLYRKRKKQQQQQARQQQAKQKPSRILPASQVKLVHLSQGFKLQQLLQGVDRVTLLALLNALQSQKLTGTAK